MDNSARLLSMLDRTISSGTLKKITLSKPLDRSVLRTECRGVTIKNSPFIQCETFTSDGKALHKNIPLAEAADYLAGTLGTQYRQMNIMTTGGDAEARVSSKGKLTVSGSPGGGQRLEPASHDREKHHIITEGTVYDFLVALNVTDSDGRVFDRRRAKFRQIDRFLQYISDIYPRLPRDGRLYVLDLCCGKSYLTFAAYWHLTSVMGREVSMVGADLKADVIAFCSDTAKRLGCSGLSFVCCDIMKFVPERSPDLVLSLHACDTATDIVLTTAARLGAKVILSTPCCQHQLMNDLKPDSPLGSALMPVMEQSLLKQKLCVALTDALRCKRLEAAGYSVTVTELIDPEDTPKNLLIRAVKVPMPAAVKEKHRAEFEALQDLCGVKLFGENLC